MDVLLFLIGLALAIAIYFAPIIVANARNHRNFTSIAIVNVFLGWTAVGWVAALAWACLAQNPVQETAARPVRAEPVLK